MPPVNTVEIANGDRDRVLLLLRCQGCRKFHVLCGPFLLVMLGLQVARSFALSYHRCYMLAIFLSVNEVVSMTAALPLL